MMADKQTWVSPVFLVVAVVIVGAIVVGVILWAQVRSLPVAGSEGGDVDLPPVEISRAPAPEQRAPRAKPVDQPDQPVMTVTPTPTIAESDQEKLERITSNWVYRGFAGVGEENTGRFTEIIEDWKTTEEFFIRQGAERRGVQVVKLSKLAATVGLGEATLAMPLVRDIRVNLSERGMPAIPSEGEVKAAMTHYSEVYGKRFREMAKHYTPKPGEIMPPPEPPSPEQVATAKARYMATWAPQFQRASDQRTPVPGEIIPKPHLNEYDEQEAVDAYYRRFRPYETPPTPAPQ
jgi:hypothetical protein